MHAIVGENGAGKSTLNKILSGIYSPDDGTLYRDGKPVAFQSPREAIHHGISTIHQEPNLVPYLSVLGNVFLGRERYGLPGVLDDRA